MRRVVYLVLTACVFAAIAIFAPAALRGALRFVVAFDAAASLLLGLYLGFTIHGDPERTRERAAAEDPGRGVGLAIALVSGIAGLSAAIAVLGHDLASAHGTGKIVEAAAGIAAMLVGWALIHTTWSLRYAHLYYRTGSGRDAGGLQFPGGLPPSDLDFMYYSFVVGMTFQVSDVSITDPRIRYETLAHALVAFAYNTAIIALGVNVASGLLH